MVEVNVKFDLDNSLKNSKSIFTKTQNQILTCRIGKVLLHSDYVNLFKTDIGIEKFQKLLSKFSATIKKDKIVQYTQKEYFFTDKIYIVKDKKEKSCWSIFNISNQDFISPNDLDFKISLDEMTEYNSTKFPSLKAYHSVKYLDITELTLEDGNIIQFKKSVENNNSYYSVSIILEDFEGLTEIINFINPNAEIFSADKVYYHNYEEDDKNDY